MNDRKLTCREIVYVVLRENANQWVNGNRFVEAGSGYRFGGRIHELRAAGHVIERRPDPTGRSRTHEYRLSVPDVAPGQATIWKDAA